jgi:hypothetical protein
MPLGDRTGPAGMGPMTGRAAGYCAGYPVPGYMNPVTGRVPYGGYYGVGRGGYPWGGGRGRAWGGGRGFGWRGIGYPYPYMYGYPGYYSEAPYVPWISPEEEENMLRQQAEAMESQLKEIQKRLQELESEAKK